MKRIISTILAISMLCTMTPAFASDIDASDVNNTPQLFSVGDGEAVVKQSAKQLNVKTADFEEQEVGQIALAEGSNHTGTNFQLYSKPNGGTEAYLVEEENGNKFFTLNNEAAGYTANSGTIVKYTMVTGNKIGLTYKIRFNKSNEDWVAININSDAGVMSGSYADVNKFGINYGGDYKTNAAASAKYNGAVNQIFAIETGVWYTLDYVFDIEKQTYDLAITSSNGDVDILLTTKDGSDPLKDIPFRATKTPTKASDMYVYAPHDSVNASKTSVGSFSLDDISSYAVEKCLYFNLIGSETLSDEAEMRLEYNNTTGEDKDVCVTYVAYEDGVVVDTDEVIETLSTDGNVADIPVSVDTTDCTGEVTYEAFVTDAQNGATLSLAGSNEGSKAPEDFVTAADADGKINVKVAKDSAYDAAIIRVFDENGSLTGIKEQKITNANIVFPVNNYNEDYKVDVTLTDAAGNNAYAETTVTVWDPAIVADFNSGDVSSAFNKHMDALNKAYGGDFVSVYSANSAVVDNYVAERNDYQSVNDIIDAVNSLQGFLDVLSAQSEDAFADALEANADSLGIILDSVYEECKSEIISKLYAAKEDFITPADLVDAYENAYLVCEFNNAVPITYSRLFEKYKTVLGITVDSNYYNAEATINEEVYKRKLEDNNGSFADADAVVKAYRNAINAAAIDENASGYAQVAVSPVSKNEVNYDFEDCDLVSGATIADGMPFGFVSVGGGNYDIVSEDGNKHVVVRQAQDTGSNNSLITFAISSVSGDEVTVEYQIRFDKQSSKWTMLNLGDLSSLYVSGNKFSLNETYKENDKTVGAARAISDVVSANVWYTVKYVIDFENQSYNITITDENGVEVANENTKPRYWASKTYTTLPNLQLFTPQSEPGEYQVSYDNVRAYADAESAVYYTAKSSANYIPGENSVAVAVENLTGADRDINVYVPVYVGGEFYTIANGSAYVADGETKDIIVTYDLTDELFTSDGNTAEEITIDVIVADSLGGFSHSVVSATTSGTVTVDAAADFEAEVINIDVDNKFDNGKLIVLVPGADIDTASPEDIVYYGAAADISIKVADGISGDFNVYVVAQDANGDVAVESDEVYYPGNGTATAMKEDFSAATEETVASVVDKYIEVIDNAAPGMADFYANNTDAVNAALVANKPYESAQDVINTIKSVKALAALKGAASEAVFKGAFKDFADMFDVKLDSIYTANEDKFISSMFAVKNSFNTYEDVMDAYNAIYMLCDINAADESTIGTKLTKYADVLGITIDEVYTSKKVYIDKLVAADMPFADEAAVVSSYNNAYSKAEKIEGDFALNVVAKSAAEMSVYEYNFDELEAVAGVTEGLSNDGYNVTVADKTNANFDVVDDNGDKYIKLYQKAGGEDAASVNITKLASGDVTSLSYRIMFEELDVGYLRMQFGGASHLYVQNNKFGINYGGGNMDVSGCKENVTTNVWYNVNYVVDVPNKMYDITITKDDGTVVFVDEDCAFRADGVGYLNYVAPHQDGDGKVTTSDTIMYIDDVKSVGYSNDEFYYSVTATNSLLPGDNMFEVDITNTTSEAVPVIIYVPVYADGKLIAVNKIFDEVIASAGSKQASLTVNVPSDLFNSGAAIDYDVFVVEQLGGVDYGVASTAKLPRVTTPAAPVVDYAAEAIKVSGTTTYDNLAILVTAPTNEDQEYDIEAAKTDDSVIAYYAPAVLKEVSSTTDAETKETIITSSFAADVKIPEQFINGVYNIYYISQNAAGETQISYSGVYYAGSDMLDDMLADFNSMTADNAEETVYTYMEVLEGVAEDAADFYENYKEEVNEALIEKDTFANVGEINSTIFSIYAIDKLANAQDTAAFKSTFDYYSNIFGIDTSSDEYVKCSSEVISRLYNDKANLTSDNIAGKYDTALMLAEFNSADRATVVDVLEKYKAATGIDPSSEEYTQYAANINKYMTAEDVTYNTLEDIKAAYAKGVEAGKSNSDSSTASKPSSTGGGGSGGSSGGSSIVSANVAAPYVENQTTLSGSANLAFSDIDSVPWAQEAITELKRIGVINGVSDTQFAPNRNVTREEFAKMIVSAFSVSGTGAAFADVPSTAWYAPYVTALASSGIVNGVSDSEFGVGTNISRQDAAVMLDRTAQHVGIEYEFDTSALHIFTDYMADYARISIYRLYQIGVVNGTSATTFSATETLTRAQAAKMIYGLMQLK